MPFLTYVLYLTVSPRPSLLGQILGGGEAYCCHDNHGFIIGIIVIAAGEKLGSSVSSTSSRYLLGPTVTAN